MSTIKQHQEMGYDRAVSMFSPDGLLLQVEYAEKAVKLGSTILAITTKEGIVFIGDRKIKSKLLVKDSFKKIFEVDNHLAISGAGVMSDGRRLIEQAQIISQDHKVNYQNPIDIITLVKEIANIQQYYSQSGGLRPFGVSLLIGGIENNKPILYQTTPSGIYMRFLARSVGNLSDKINEEMEKTYKESMSNKEAISYALKLFKKAMEEEFDLERFDVATLDLKENLNKVPLNELSKLN
ncbi:MAG: archaeal proteasome endopeptidase complex subunit alpha [Nanoarchaeota archaeon]|nr:archaeal proteasome endopeptidase complex subunit alpha [Nanoarchaeota archaeon]MCA9495524.1 archaeal proteasome endopeptidase complex subunit alpha [Nanoarchaeota archaeon]